MTTDSNQFDETEEIMSEGACPSIKGFVKMPIKYTIIPKLPKFEYPKYYINYRSEALRNKIRAQNKKLQEHYEVLKDKREMENYLRDKQNQFRG